MLGTISKGIMGIPHLANLVGEPVEFYLKNRGPQRARALLGWGNKEPARKAKALAEKDQLPFIYLEDGFLRSTGLGVNGSPPFSLLMDEVGLYYDSKQPSTLKRLLDSAVLDQPFLQEAQQALTLLLDHNLTKYNHAPDATCYFFSEDDAKVLVIDQTAGDQAIVLGEGTDKFDVMLETALTENPTSLVYLKIHPDVLSGKRSSCFSSRLLTNPRIRPITEDVNSLSLLKQFNKIYTVTSQMGFEAVLAGKEVICFGKPWYGNRGVTEDRATYTEAQRPRSALELFALAYMLYARYINPNTGERGTIFDVIAYLIKARQLNAKLAGKLACIGFPVWKRTVIRKFLNRSTNTLKFYSKPEYAKTGDKLVVWGSAFPDCKAAFRVEDGFLRSVGLGSDLVRPYSLVADDTGIYYDGTSSSELERILNTKEFDFHELAKAKSLRQLITSQNLTKYNVEQQRAVKIPQDKKILFIPGQVGDDASILKGAIGNITTLSQVICHVRACNPEAFLLYKPHPDVLSGNRKGTLTGEAEACLDKIETDADVLSCLQVADEVHTLTSFTGMDALLREIPVFTYGLPFYAGWGLTTDYCTTTRRTRKLSLDALVAGVYLDYPLYWDWKMQRFVDVFVIARRLLQDKQQKSRLRIRDGYIKRQLIKGMAWITEIKEAVQR